jgi:hypothetical protein
MKGTSRSAAVGLVALLAGACGGADARASAGSELRELYVSPATRAMGGASVAAASAEDAIFANPAAMAGNQKLQFNYLPVSVEASTDLIANAQDLKKFDNFNASTVNSMMGQNIFGRVSVTPNLLMPNFGFSLIFDDQVVLAAKNQQLPQAILGYQMTNGLQVSYGTSLLANRRMARKQDLRVGVGAKLLFRKGGYHLLPLSDLLTADKDTIPRLTGDFGMGYGFDLGTQYIVSALSNVQLLFGGAFTEIGGVKFNSIADSQPGNFSMGFAAKLRIPRVTATLAYDYRHVFDDADWRKKQHIGLQVEMPVFSVYGGLSQLSWTYGASFDIWLLRITAASYGEDLATLAGQDTERRYELQIALKI